MNKTFPTPIQGFTLIEMTVVLLLITLLASVAIRETNSLSFQVRYEQTQERLERIREAILGNPRQIINGQQAISGFVADMGRLPDELRELLQPGFCYDSDGNLLPSIKRPSACISPSTWTYKQVPCSDGVSNTETLCSAAAATWTGKNSDPAGLSWGWQGPYLNISGNPDDKDAFVDGWGRMAQGYCTNIIYTDEATCTTNGAIWIPLASDNNYGWYYDTVSYTDGLFVQSYGKDHVSGGLDYDADYPSQPIINAGDWQVSLANGISVQFQAPLLSGVCREDNASQTTCYGNSGHWENCLFFTAAKCAATGGNWGTDCRWTQSACTAKGGIWNSSGNPQCVFDATTCPTAGGAWSTSENLCSFTPNACLSAGGAATRSCLFNSTTCTGTGKAWDATNHSCSFTSGQCSTDGGIYTTNGTNASCLRTYKTPATSNEEYNATSCPLDGKIWPSESPARAVLICMKIFYRQDGSVVNPPSISAPIPLEENNMVRQLHFTGFSVSDIPTGVNAVGIYEHDGTDCTSTLYPADRQTPIQVDFHPRTGLPVINW
jgi:prepilin-type N-terminal cleavage/methylation domain-containing protein